MYFVVKEGFRAITKPKNLDGHFLPGNTRLNAGKGSKRILPFSLIVLLIPCLTMVPLSTYRAAADICGNDGGNGNEIISGPSGPSGPDRDSIFRSLTVHPTDPNTIWVGTERNGFLKSTDGGATWTRHRLGLRHNNGGYPEIWDIAVFPSNPNVLFAATLDSPGPVTGDHPSSIGGIYKSTDGGESWVRKNCGLNSSRINSIRFDPTNSDIAIAGVEGGEATFSSLAGQYFDGGLFRTSDGGDTWNEITVDVNDGKNGFWHMKVRGGNPSTFVTFGMNLSDSSENHGFLISTDSGANWASFANGLNNLLITDFDLSSDGTVIYANERDSFKIRRSTDSGATWSTVPGLNANGPVAVSPADPQLVLYVARSSGGSIIHRSADGLATRSTVLTTSGEIQDIVFAPSDPTVVYVGASGFLIYKSTDSGATFSFIKDIRSQVSNISTHAVVQTEDDVMIGGFIIGGNTAKTVLVRARGPTLADFGVPGALDDPFLQLFSGQTVIAQNDNWQTTDPLCGSPAVSCGGSAEITAMGLDPCVGNLTGCAQESANYITLRPGSYTAWCWWWNGCWFGRGVCN